MAYTRTGDDVNQEIRNVLEYMAETGGTAVETPAVTVYDGGGTANALRDNIGTSALPAGAAVIAVGENDELEVTVFNATAGEALTLLVREYSAAVPTLATLETTHPRGFGAADADLADCTVVGITPTGTDYAVKGTVKVDVRRNRFVQLCVKEDVTGPVYATYALRAK